MKRFLTILLAVLFAFVFVSCENVSGGSGATQQSQELMLDSNARLIGTWSYSYENFREILVFGKDGMGILAIIDYEPFLFTWEAKGNSLEMISVSPESGENRVANYTISGNQLTIFLQDNPAGHILTKISEEAQDIAPEVGQGDDTISYTIQHHYENINGEYIFETETKSMPVWGIELIKQRTGYEAEPSIIYAKDIKGNNTVIVRHTRKTVVLEFDPNGGTWSDGTTRKIILSGKYETPVQNIPQLVKDNYDKIWQSYSSGQYTYAKDYPEYFPASNVNYKAIWEPKTLTFDKSVFTLYCGDKINLAQHISSGTSDNLPLTWSSSDPTSASVDNYGNITAKNAAYSTGVTITAKSYVSGKTATCKLKIFPTVLTYDVLRTICPDYKTIEEFEIPHGFTAIASYNGISAFRDFANLRTLTIPATIQSIGGSGFTLYFNGPSLANVYYKGTLAQWAGISFSPSSYGNFPENTNIYINGTLLKGDIDLSGASSIGDYAFYKLKNITSVYAPNAVTIGEGTFSGCENLNSVNLPNTTVIDSSAFSNCVNLRSISLPKATTIGNSAFYGCKNLNSVSIPNVTHIYNSAFSSCANLSTVSAHNLQYIYREAFLYCKNLTVLDIDINGRWARKYTYTSSYDTYSDTSYTEELVPISSLTKKESDSSDVTNYWFRYKVIIP